MNAPNVKTIALIGLPVLVICGLLGLVVVTALDDEPETITTVVPASETIQAVGGGTAGDGATRPNRDAADAGVVDSDDRPLSAAELDRVQRAALRITGGGTVSDVDRSDDLGEAYEVEVVSDAGEVDIALNRDLERVANLRYDD